MDDYNNIRIANASNTKIFYILFSNGLLKFSIISQSNRVTYITDITHKDGYISLASIFIV